MVDQLTQSPSPREPPITPAESGVTSPPVALRSRHHLGNIILPPGFEQQRALSTSTVRLAQPSPLRPLSPEPSPSHQLAKKESDACEHDSRVKTSGSESGHGNSLARVTVGNEWLMSCNQRVRYIRPTGMAKLKNMARDTHEVRMDCGEQDGRLKTGISPANQGNLDIHLNHPADVPDELSCSLYITGLPAVQLSEFLVEGHETLVRYNRNRVAQPDLPLTTTHVVVVPGPKNIVEEQRLLEFFTQTLMFELDGQVKLFWESITRRSLEIRFGSYRAQAQTAVLHLQNRHDLVCGVVFRFGRDPCA